MVGGPAQYGTTALTLRCTKGDGKPGVSRRMPGAGLSLWRPGRPRLTGQPSSRTGENPPYGMSGGIEETSASCEARSAPRSYPTRRMVQTALREAARLGLLTIEERRRESRRNLPNVIRIVSKEWMTWLARGGRPSYPRAEPLIGCKKMRPTDKSYKNQRSR